MKTGDGGAGNRDEGKRKDLSGKDRPRSVDELGQGWHLKLGCECDNSHAQERHGADLEKGAQIVTGSQQEPDRENGGQQSIDHDADGKCASIEGQPWFQRRSLDPLTRHHREEKGCHTKGAGDPQ